jgi:cobalt/nickel transport system ATP-binding protein
MMEAALEFRGLVVRYGDGVPVLDRLDLRIDPGERVALLGLNGSGKTTLLMAAVGLVACDGIVRVLGETLSDRTVGAIRRRTGMLFNVPEDQILLPRVVDDVAFGPTRRGVSTARARSDALATLASLGIDEAVAAGSVHALSHGQKQRVALAGALVTRPDLLLLDEPSAGLDPPGRTALARLLAGIDVTLLVATHDTEFARRTCSRFILLEGGRVAWDGADLAGITSRWDAGGPG